MNSREIHSMPGESLLARPHYHGSVTRRQFLQAGAIALAAGLAPLDAVAANGRPAADPRPTWYGTQFLGPSGPLFHAQAPGYPIPDTDTDPATHDPATITDFNGFVGLAYVGGQGTHHDHGTGQTTTVYWEVDMRFMVGEYIGKDGRHNHGTFGFV